MRIRDWDRNLKVRLFGEALINLTFWMFFPFLTIYFTEAFGKGLAGLMLIVSQLFSVAANLLGGFYADRFGRKRMMVIAAAGQGVSFFLFALANSPWYQSALVSFICFSAAGVFGAFYYPASQAMVADVVEEKDRSSVFAVFYTSINIAVVLGPILGGIFYVSYKFELLLAAGASCLAVALMLWKWTRETAAPFKPEKAGSSWMKVLSEQLGSYSVILRDRTFLLFIVAGILIAQTFMQLDLLLPVYIKEVLSQSTLFSWGGFDLKLNGEQLFGLVLSENGLIVAAFTVFVTNWMSKYREKHVFILSSVVYGISILLFGLLAGPWGIIVAMALFSFAELMTAGIQQSFISKLAPEHMRGQYFAAASLRNTIGRTIAPLSIPLTMWIGFTGTFVALAALAILSAVLFGAMFRRMEREASGS